MPPFFSRPNITDEQFKQLSGSDNILTLSGQTRIASTSGLTLTDGLGGYIPIIATGGTLGRVLTYDATGKITLQPSTGTGGGVYSGASPTTCTVGGLNAGSPIYGQSISNILQTILVPTLSATTTNPFASFNLTITPTLSISLVREVGSTIHVTGTSVFNRGTISPQYCGTSPYRSGLPTAYQYCYGAISVGTCVNANPYLYGSKVVNSGNNYFGSRVFYASGTTPIYDSAGNVSLPALASGCTPSGGAYNSNNICGQYAWYWGNSSSAPAINQALLNSYAGKCVASSANAITVDNYNVTGKYIWFAIPAASPDRIAWQGANNPSNNGVIAGGLFPAGTTIYVASPEGYWGGIQYKFYVSNYATNINYGMTFCK